MLIRVARRISFTTFLAMNITSFYELSMVTFAAPIYQRQAGIRTIPDEASFLLNKNA